MKGGRLALSVAWFPVALSLICAALPTMGRAAETGRPPARIVSLVPRLTEALFVIGAGPQVVGVTQFCTWPAEAKTRRITGGAVGQTINLEEIVALRPDLVLASVDGQDAAIAALRRIGITVETMDPRSIDEVLASFRTLGERVGRPAEGAALADWVAARLATVEAAVAALAKPAPRVFYHVWDEPLMTASPRTFLGELIRRAGGRHLFPDLVEDYPQVSEEALLARDPEVIVGPSYHGDQLRLDVLRSRPALAATTAVRTGRVVVLDGDVLSRGGPRLAEALRLMAVALHPELAPVLAEPMLPPIPIGGAR